MGEQASLPELIRKAVENNIFVRYSNKEIGFLEAKQIWSPNNAKQLLKKHGFESIGQRDRTYFFWRTITPENAEHTYKNLQQFYDIILKKSV